MIYNKLFKLRHLVALMALMVLFSCSEDYPENIVSPNKVVLKSIKIVNAGANGDVVIEGTVDENTKTVTFPRIDTATDFSAIKFEAEMSSGAKLDQEMYDLGLAEGDTKKTMVIKVLNGTRFREYLVTIRLLVPVYGADFSKAQVYDNTNNELGNPIYPTFVSNLTRGSGFDGENVLIIARAGWHTPNVHLLKYSDLKNNTIAPIPLNITGVTGGTYLVDCGAIINGHIYVASLSGGQVSPLKIYHWTDPGAAPDVIADINIASIPGAGSRHGDNLSVNIDENGNGYMYFGDNAVTEILRLKVTNFTTISDPKVLPTQTGVTAFMTYNQVGHTDKYLLTGYEAPIMVVDNSGVVSYTLDANAVPIRGTDARVVYFNGERYLIMTTAARRGSDAVVLYVYDITKGDDIAEALDIFAASEKKPLYKYSLLGPTNSAPSTQTGWYVKKDAEGKDESLVLYAASNNAGFVLIEFPKKVLED